MNKPVLSAAEREAARVRAVEETKIRVRCKALADQLTEAGWSNVTVALDRVFYAIRGDDPQGVNRSGAYPDAEVGIQEMLEAGKAPPPRKLPEAKPADPEILIIETAPAPSVQEAVAKLAETVNPPPADAQEVDEFRNPKRHSYGEDDEPPPKPKAEESVPLPLATIVPPNLDLMAQKAWAQQRWLDLNARLLDEAKPEDKRAFNEMSKAEKAELELLQRWIGWFS